MLVNIDIHYAWRKKTQRTQRKTIAKWETIRLPSLMNEGEKKMY